MPANQPQARWRRMNMPAFVFAVTVAMFVLLWGAVSWHTWQRLRAQNISARLTSARTVIWGDAHVDVTVIQPHLQRSADALRSHGFKPRLLIEHYRDTRDTDIAALARIGHNAGFDIVETHAHNWDSAAPREPND